MERTDKLNQLKQFNRPWEAVAENPYNSDYHRVLFNVLLVITGFECF